MGVRDLICWLDLLTKISLPIVLQFHSVHARLQFFTAYFPVASLGLSLVLGCLYRPLVREGAPQRQHSNVQTEYNIGSRVPE
jgi:hypothetical protein